MGKKIDREEQEAKSGGVGPKPPADL